MMNACSFLSKPVFGLLPMQSCPFRTCKHRIPTALCASQAKCEWPTNGQQCARSQTVEKTGLPFV
eukprot:1159872-Pelagomonas_calceolata.AAC.7